MNKRTEYEMIAFLHEAYEQGRGRRASHIRPDDSSGPSAGLLRAALAIISGLRRWRIEYSLALNNER